MEVVTIDGDPHSSFNVISLGIGDSSPGMFLAHHRSTLGPYFGSVEENNWPSAPLRKKPLQLEARFNKQMMRITEILTNGSLTDISILDFSAFGSKIANLELKHRRESNWPTEMNFALWDENQGSIESMFYDYKRLLIDWKHYMTKMYLKEPDAVFTPLMENIQSFNFTRYHLFIT